MGTINKVTTLSPVNGAPVSDAIIQAHIDAMNTDGWRLVGAIGLIGWFKFFWAKDE